jgi:hypothetical protein
MRIIILIILFTACIRVVGQDSSFKEQKKHIDSLIVLIDMNNDLSFKAVQGRDSIFGDYTGSFLYRRSDKTVVKIESKTIFDTDASKVFYYVDDNLIRLSDKRVIYYYLDNFLVDELGKKVSTPETGDLLIFEKSIKNLLKILLSD